MYDSPTLSQLLDAVRYHLESQVIPAVENDRKLYYQTLVAINVLHIVQRELLMSPDHLRAEWHRLNFVQNVTMPLPNTVNELRAALAERNRKLCQEIDAGRYDYMPQRAALFEHLLMTAQTQLEVANPRFLGALAAEDSA
jgi:hypothetical protein